MLTPCALGAISLWSGNISDFATAAANVWLGKGIETHKSFIPGKMSNRRNRLSRLIKVQAAQSF